jgi:hypothetical protein
MTRLATILTALLPLASPATATELFAAAGDWAGEGRIAIGPAAPLERGRCRIEIAPDPAGQDVSITGRCAVAAGLSDISLRLLRGQGGRVNAGIWSAATGQIVQFAGTETAESITLAATAPVLLDGVGYEARVELVAPEADGFTLRQLLRGEGETAWRLVVDMAYRPAGR